MPKNSFNFPVQNQKHLPHQIWYNDQQWGDYASKSIYEYVNNKIRNNDTEIYSAAKWFIYGKGFSFVLNCSEACLKRCQRSPYKHGLYTLACMWNFDKIYV